jgi:hypothetical protein
MDTLSASQGVQVVAGGIDTAKSTFARCAGWTQRIVWSWNAH